MSKGDELTFGQIRKFLNTVDNKQTSIAFTGGEPFLRKDIMNIIEFVKKRGFSLRLITNATLLNSSIIRKIVELNVDEICISLEGDKNVHDKIRGKDTFDKVIWSLSELNHYRDKKIKIYLWCTISNYNINNLKETVKIAHKHNVSIIYFQNVFFSKVPKINLKVLNKKIKYIESYAEKNRIVAFFYNCDDMKNLLMWYSNRPFIGRCGTIRTMRIKPDGEVTHCRFKRRSFGNIKNRSFNDIWFSDEYIKFRKDISNIVSDCGRCCNLQDINLAMPFKLYTRFY